MTTEAMMFCLLQNEICGTPLPSADLTYDARALYRLAKSHDIMHLVADALFRNGMMPASEKARRAYQQERLVAVYREEHMRRAMALLRETLQKAQIPFIPLKGAAIRPLYPQPWMRTSCDIDVLVHAEDLEKATMVLADAGFTTDGKRSLHDMVFIYEGVHVELHYSVTENIGRADGVLARVWEYSRPVAGAEYDVSPDFFLFYHIAHMLFHFLVGGGCGVRPFLDLFIMRQAGFCREEQGLPLLKPCRMDTFCHAAYQLADVWFGGQPHTELTKQLEVYVLAGELYGSTANKNASGAVRREGRVRYLWHLAFLPYEIMCQPYPILRRHKILLPFCYVHRFFAKLFGKTRRRAHRRMTTVMRQDQARIEQVDALFGALDLK